MSTSPASPAARLAAHLREAHLNSAAALLRLDLRDEAQAILRDIAEAPARPGWTAGQLRAWRAATTAIARRWEKGDDEVVGRAFDAWEARGSEDCAILVATHREHACDDCRAARAA